MKGGVIYKVLIWEGGHIEGVGGTEWVGGYVEGFDGTGGGLMEKRVK